MDDTRGDAACAARSDTGRACASPRASSVRATATASAAAASSAASAAATARVCEGGEISKRQMAHVVTPSVPRAAT